MNLGGIITGATLVGRAGISQVAGMAGSAWGKVAGVATGAGASLSSASGGLLGTGAATALATGGGGMSLVMALLLAGDGLSQSIAQRDVLVEMACEELTEDASAASGGTSDMSEEAEENAKIIYSVLSHAGMNDQNIAGILGNFTAESGNGLDSTAVERVYDEPFEIGPKKQALWDQTSAEYPLGFANQPTGIGLAQWTWDRATKLIELAEDVGGEWYEMEVQLAYMLSTDSGAPVVQDMVNGDNEGADDPVQAAVFFHDNWERSADSRAAVMENRGGAAGKWYAQMSNWTVDTSLAGSVLAMAEQTQGMADKAAVAAELDKCPGLSSVGGGNTDAAEAAVTLAWPHVEDSRGNDGTDAYVYVHDEVYEGDPYYASCDRTVGTAVRWSGTDDTYPPGAVVTQMAYLKGEGKEKWEEIGVGLTADELEPGDVLLTNDGAGHTFMYVGEDMVEEIWAGDHTEGGIIVSGSLNDRSPGVNADGELNDGRSYTAFRSKGGEKNSEFSDITLPGSIKPGAGDKNRLTTPGAG